MRNVQKKNAQKQAKRRTDVLRLVDGNGSGLALAPPHGSCCFCGALALGSLTPVSKIQSESRNPFFLQTRARPVRPHSSAQTCAQMSSGASGSGIGRVKSEEPAAARGSRCKPIVIDGDSDAEADGEAYVSDYDDREESDGEGGTFIVRVKKGSSTVADFPHARPDCMKNAFAQVRAVNVMHSLFSDSHFVFAHNFCALILSCPADAARSGVPEVLLCGLRDAGGGVRGVGRAL